MSSLEPAENVSSAAGPGFLPPDQGGVSKQSFDQMIRANARIAVYDDLLSAPRIIDVEPAPILLFIENIAVTTYERAKQQGGLIPYSVIREISENFIHANFKECTVSILDHGNTIRFSDQGPGIEKKLLVRQPGVTSASEEMRRYIKGVGSGFPIVSEYLQINSGYMSIDDNAIDGAVITLKINQPEPFGIQAPSTGRLSMETPVKRGGEHYDLAALSAPIPITKAAEPLVIEARMALALQTIEELGAAGPTDLTDPLNISPATATRLLQSLEENGLVEKVANRKRILSNAGLQLLRRLPGH